MPALTTESPSVAVPKAPHVVGAKVKKATRPTTQLPEYLLEEARTTKRVSFDPKEHLIFEPPQNVVTMKEIGLEGHGISPIAVSDPFPLFSKEAMLQMRAEAFSEAVLKDCRFATDLTPNAIRGQRPEHAPFTYDAWYSPEVTKIVSDVAGIELVPAFDYEIANLHVAINAPIDDSNKGGDQTSAAAWHYDSYPFVCVTMAADCTGMVGGETAVQLPNGDIRKVRGPAMGTAVVMQGRYMYHQALKAYGGRERISMVTAYRPKSAFVRDETILVGSRPISNLGQLYAQYTEYRLKNLIERFKAKQEEEESRETAEEPYSIPQMREFLQEQRDYIDVMLEQIIEVE